LIDADMNQALYILQTTVGMLKQTKQDSLAAASEKRFMDYAQRAGLQ
jgi:hypothetical protein